jgi:hypothetical protein
MSCTICFNSYDHSVHKPYTLSCLLHTYCISCIEKLDKRNCPICNEPITKKHPNIALLEFIPESKYDKLKSETLKSLHELKEIKQNLNQKRDEKLNEYLQQIGHVKQAINKQSNKFVKLIKSNKLKLLNELSLIEVDLKKKCFNSNQIIENDVEIRVNNSKFMLENNECSKKKLIQLNKDTCELKTRLNELLMQIEQFNENYEFKLNKKLKLNDGVIGKIQTNQKVNNFRINFFNHDLTFFSYQVI